MFKNIYTTRMSGSSKVLEKRFEKITAKPVKFKRMLALICVTVILSVLVLNTLVMAQIANESTDYNIDIINNGEVIELENKPFIEDGEVYVPLRELFTKLGFMASPEAEIAWDNGEILIKLYEKSLNEDAVAEYTMFAYKIEIGKSELVINPEALVPRYTPDEVTSFAEEMDNAPVLKKNITYIPFSYAERMVERADVGFYSPPDRYKLEYTYSGEMLNIAYPFEEYYEITQGFGKRVHPITGEEQFHTGIDFAAPAGTPILAGIEGNFDVGYDEEKGAYMTIYGENGVEVTYCSLDSKILQTLWNVMWISKGNLLGFVGNTGKSTGPHLHMEVKVNGEYVNPEQYINDESKELLHEVSDDIPRTLRYCGYPDADYEIVKCSIDERNAYVEVVIKNYENKTLGINFYRNAGGKWWLGAVFDGPELILIT
ncbi:MAG: peptidoglycan DD-metalloendopeptidase family protein [Clostridia bacterium]|nr:peptidoglycan DD-metalloendopeptidase family protein [Clostridia bacterium]